MGNPFPEIPDELLPKIGDALKGWKHAGDTLSATMPATLQRANLIRRGSLQYLNHPRKRNKAK